MWYQQQSLRRYFEENDGRIIHKWAHYFPVYERYLSPFRRRTVTMLEIGVFHGGSLQMWKHYLGRRARIVGIDIESRVSDLPGRDIDIIIGDQSDEAFLAKLVDRYKAFDIILDDGSHFPEHQVASIEYLWPHLNEEGIYIVEDVHSSYRSGRFGSDRGLGATFIDWLRKRIDDMHAWHSKESDFEVNDWTRTLGSIHLYDSIVVLKKEKRSPPSAKKIGHPSF